MLRIQLVCALKTWCTKTGVASMVPLDEPFLLLLLPLTSQTQIMPLSLPAINRAPSGVKATARHGLGTRRSNRCDLGLPVLDLLDAAEQRMSTTPSCRLTTSVSDRIGCQARRKGIAEPAVPQDLNRSRWCETARRRVTTRVRQVTVRKNNDTLGCYHVL
jgi:hypothetical protein